MGGGVLVSFKKKTKEFKYLHVNGHWWVLPEGWLVVREEVARRDIERDRRRGE
jgi:hypothetical protein